MSSEQQKPLVPRLIKQHPRTASALGLLALVTTCLGSGVVLGRRTAPKTQESNKDSHAAMVQPSLSEIEQVCANSTLALFSQTNPGDNAGRHGGISIIQQDDASTWGLTSLHVMASDKFTFKVNDKNGNPHDVQATLSNFSDGLDAALIQLPGRSFADKTPFTLLPEDITPQPGDVVHECSTINGQRAAIPHEMIAYDDPFNSHYNYAEKRGGDTVQQGYFLKAISMGSDNLPASSKGGDSGSGVIFPWFNEDTGKTEYYLIGIVTSGDTPVIKSSVLTATESSDLSPVDDPNKKRISYTTPIGPILDGITRDNAALEQLNGLSR